jgi:RING finger protein 121
MLVLAVWGSVLAGAFGFLVGPAVLLVLYGIYFGVLGRDLAEVCAERMASTMGYSSSSGLPARHLERDICAICAGRLDFDNTGFFGKTYELNCNHKFHEFCIRGWTIVGKKDVCPYCKEKVDLRQTLLKNPWETGSVVWTNILDMARQVIVWNPLIIFLTTIIADLIDRPN